MASKVRLFVEHPLGQGQSVPVSRDQAHYLFNVMRLSVGTSLTLFNGADGSWDARVAETGKRGGVLACVTLDAPQVLPPDLWLVCAPIRKARMGFVIEKAVELGVRRIVPVQTEYTNERMRQDKLQAHAVEAAEQCGANFVPEVADLTRLPDVLSAWPADRSLMFCDEGKIGQTLSLAPALSAPSAVVIGPEGGFSPAERDQITALPQAHAISLGPRILRADTAVVAALTLWQSTHGDWT